MKIKVIGHLKFTILFSDLMSATFAETKIFTRSRYTKIIGKSNSYKLQNGMTGTQNRRGINFWFIFIMMNFSEQTFRSYTTWSQEVIQLIRVHFRLEPNGPTLKWSNIGQRLT